VVGESNNANDANPQPQIWRNGTRANLMPYTNLGRAQSVQVSGGVEYAVGQIQYGETVFWTEVFIDGEPVEIGFGEFEDIVGYYTTSGNFPNQVGNLHSIFVSGSDYYAVGWFFWLYPDGQYIHQIPTVWKNGDLLYVLADLGLPEAEMTTQTGRAMSVTVHNGDVYVAGIQGTIPTVWKNGAVLHRMETPNTGYVNTMAWSIFVKDK